MTDHRLAAISETAIAIVRCYSPLGVPTTVVTCFTPEAIVYAVNRCNHSDFVKVCAL